MFLEIISPDKKLYSGEVSIVQLPGTTGSFEIMNNHAPIISTLGHGKIKITDTNKKIEYVDIKSGVVEVQHNKIIVLVE